MANSSGSRMPADVKKFLKLEVRKRTWYGFFQDKLTNYSPEICGGVETKDLKPHGLALPWAILYIGASFASAFYLTYLGTTTLLGAKYLALDKTDPNAVCKDVPQPVSGSFEGSSDGLWVTDPAFDYSKSIFTLEFTGSSLGNETFTKVMNKFADQLTVYGAKAKVRNAAFANALYATYTLQDAATNMKFYSSAQATDIFFNQVATAIISGKNGTCNSYKTTSRYIAGSFDRATKQLVAEVPIQLVPSYIGNSINKTLAARYPETCSSIANFIPQYFDPAFAANKGGVEGFGSLKFEFDVNSMLTVIALNQGLTKASDLTRISAHFNVPDGVKPPIRNYEALVAYIDPYSFSPNREPVYCYDKTNPALGLTNDQINGGPDVCFLGSHNEGQSTVQLYYPVLAQVANNPARSDKYGNLKMEQCTCPDFQYNTYCNYQDVIWGAIFDYGNSTSPGHLDKIAFAAQAFYINNKDGNGDVLATNYFSDILTFTANVDYARDTADTPIVSFTTSAGVAIDNSWSGGMSYNQLLNAAWTTVCPWGTCAAFVFESYSDDVTYSYVGLNRYHVQLAEFSNQTFKGSDGKVHKLQMCVDTVSQAAALKKLARFPPIALTQAYYECRPTILNAFVSSIGNAAGTAALIVQVGAIVVGFSLIFAANKFFKRRSRDVDKLMGKDDKEEVMSAYEKLKTEALCEMLKASVDSIKSLKERIVQLEARGQSRDEQTLTMTRLLAQRLDGVDKLMKGDFGFGSGSSSAQDDAAAAAADAAAAAAISDAAAAEKELQEKAKSHAAEIEKRVQATLEEKLSDEREKQSRAKDDVDFYESLLVRKYDRFKLLFKIEDVLVAEQAQEVAGGFGLNDDDDAESVDSRYWDPPHNPSDLQAEHKGLVGSVVDGLQLVNPFSYLPNPFSAPAQAQAHGHGHGSAPGHAADDRNQRPWGESEELGQARQRTGSISSVSTDEVRAVGPDSRLDIDFLAGQPLRAPVDERDWSQTDHVQANNEVVARRGRGAAVSHLVNVPCYK